MAPRIVNNFDYPVILDDNRNAQTSWENHIRRGSAGGVDMAYPYGSAVRANADGTLWWFKGNGSAGWYAQLRIADAPGWIIEYYHMSDFQLPPNVNGVPIRVGQLVGLSGASGFGQSRYYAPHLHVHLVINGRRVNLFNYFTSSAGGGVTPIDPPEPEPEIFYHEENDMRIIWLCDENSDPIPVPGGSAGQVYSRVWGGKNRVIGGIPYSNGWDSSTGCRLTVREHEKLLAVSSSWETDGRNKSGSPLVLENRIHPNELEQILVGRGLA